MSCSGSHPSTLPGILPSVTSDPLVTLRDRHLVLQDYLLPLSG